MRDERLKLLEENVLEASKRLLALRAERQALAKKTAQLDEENARLRAELKRLKSVEERHVRLRARLERLAQKIDKAVDAPEALP